MRRLERISKQTKNGLSQPRGATARVGCHRQPRSARCYQQPGRKRNASPTSKLGPRLTAGWNHPQERSHPTQTLTSPEAHVVPSVRTGQMARSAPRMWNAAIAIASFAAHVSDSARYGMQSRHVIMAPAQASQVIQPPRGRAPGAAAAAAPAPPSGGSCNRADNPLGNTCMAPMHAIPRNPSLCILHFITTSFGCRNTHRM